MNIDEASEYIGANPQDMRYWASLGYIPATKVDNGWDFSTEILDLYEPMYGGYAKAPQPESNAELKDLLEIQ